MTEVRVKPCTACPYRRDVPSGVWHPDEYEKLRRYDAETFAQPPNGFACHASPDFYCHGWALTHMSRGDEYELLALRIQECTRPVDIPPPMIPLFDSGNEAADHGQRDVDNPGPGARVAVEHLLRRESRHTRLS